MILSDDLVKCIIIGAKLGHHTACRKQLYTVQYSPTPLRMNLSADLTAVFLQYTADL